ERIREDRSYGKVEDAVGAVARVSSVGQPNRAQLVGIVAEQRRVEVVRQETGAQRQPVGGHSEHSPLGQMRGIRRGSEVLYRTRRAPARVEQREQARDR